MPRLQGKKGSGRECIYCWYSRSGGPTGKEWARNQRYKLYRTGEFYDVGKDVLEKASLKDSDLSDDAGRIKAMLQKALDQYKDARRSGPANRKKKKRTKRK